MLGSRVEDKSFTNLDQDDLISSQIDILQGQGLPGWVNAAGAFDVSDRIYLQAQSIAQSKLEQSKAEVENKEVAKFLLSSRLADHKPVVAFAGKEKRKEPDGFKINISVKKKRKIKQSSEDKHEKNE